MSGTKSHQTVTATFGFAFDAYERQISRNALSRFDLFLEIYAKNLEKQLETSTASSRQALEDEIQQVSAMSEKLLDPSVVKPGSAESRDRARRRNHTYENTSWRGGI